MKRRSGSRTMEKHSGVQKLIEDIRKELRPADPQGPAVNVIDGDVRCRSTGAVLSSDGRLEALDRKIGSIRGQERELRSIRLQCDDAGLWKLIGEENNGRADVRRGVYDEGRPTACRQPIV